jgi:glycosyltransferase involved in cell wall biosynthesis
LVLHCLAQNQSTASLESVKMRVLHVLYQSLPDKTGSSIRSHDLLKAQSQLGIDVYVVTGPFQRGKSNDPMDIIDGICYRRTGHPRSHALGISEQGAGALGRMRKIFAIFSFQRAIVRLAKDLDVDIIHAHGTFFCGLASYFAAKKRRVKFCYEVRSLWEERILFSKQIARVYKARLVKSIETWVAKKADALFVICDGLRNEFLSRGLRRDRVYIVPNGMHSKGVLVRRNAFNGITSPLRVGYVGSLSPIEGLPILINASAAILNAGRKVEVHIWGKGSDEDAIKHLVEEKGWDEIVFHGGFEPEQREQVYGSLDVVVNPRLESRLTRLVTPLKPLEAMLYGRLFIGSDIPGIREVTGDGRHGILVAPDDEKALKMVLENILNDIEAGVLNRYIALIDDASLYVKDSRSWLSIGKTYVDVYGALVFNKE